MRYRGRDKRVLLDFLPEVPNGPSDRNNFSRVHVGLCARARALDRASFFPKDGEMQIQLNYHETTLDLSGPSVFPR